MFTPTQQRTGTTVKTVSSVRDEAFLVTLGVAQQPKPEIYVTQAPVVDEQTYTQTPAAANPGQQTPKPAASDWKETVKNYWWIGALLVVAAGSWYAWKKGLLKLM